METITDNIGRQRYEILVDGTLAGFVTYRRRPDVIELLHTEIGAAFEGQGLASHLIRLALDDARDHGVGVLPFCPFVKAYIERHPDQLDLVPAGSRARFGL